MPKFYVARQHDGQHYPLGAVTADSHLDAAQAAYDSSIDPVSHLHTKNTEDGSTHYHIPTEGDADTLADCGPDDGTAFDGMEPDAFLDLLLSALGSELGTGDDEEDETFSGEEVESGGGSFGGGGSSGEV